MAALLNQFGGAISANISSIAEPGEARLPKRPASKARFNFPQTAPQLAG